MSAAGPLGYQALADLHRPVDEVVVTREIRRLAQDGFSVRDIATALRCHVDVVSAALASAPTRPPARRPA